jgi:hypothetical protein
LSRKYEASAIRIPLWIRREHPALSVTGNCRERIDDSSNGIAASRFRTLKFWLAVKFRNAAFPLPKLNIVTVDVLLCGFDCCVIVGALKLDAPHDMAVVAKDINSIIGHQRAFGPGRPSLEQS